MLAGGPFKPGFGLSGAVLLLDRVFPLLICIFVSILQRPSQPIDVTTAGPSTPQIIAFAMICYGRDNETVGMTNWRIRTSPLKPKPGLNGPPSELLSNQERLPLAGVAGYAGRG
jgi:hypothetical protein